MRARAFVVTAVLALFGVTLAASASSDEQAGEQPCAAQEVEYTLTASLELRDTPMGQGDGVYHIGPGRAVLRFQGRDVKLLAYTMQEHFRVHSKTLFWATNVQTDAVSSATPDQCSVAAEGTLDGETIHWRTPVAGYRTDGTLTCDGSFCGKMGAPPPGRSTLKIGPAPIPFGPFVFANGGKTFTMARTPATKTEQPKQTSAVAVSGREIRRTCVQPPPCR
jgi:hypothetical protein